MRGIHYLTDENGTRTAVVIDLHQHGEALEDFLDGLEAESRRSEPREDFNAAVAQLLAERSGE